MIHANRIVTVGEQECIIDRPIVLYRGDREVEIEFTLVGNEFTFSEEGNVIKSVNASHGQLVLNTPSGEHMFSELAECHEGKVVFVVTKEMIDEFIEMGFYSFQIRLYDSAEMKSRVTIPPVMNGFDIRNPIASEDETNVVDQGIVDYARIFKDQSNEELPTFTWDGEYVKTEWAHHDVITENKMNKIEDALYSINANIKESDVVMLNTLDQVKKDADAYVKEHMAEVEADVDEFERNLNTGVEQFKIDTNAAMTAHKNEVSEVVDGFSGEIESINTQLAHIENNLYVVVPSKSEDEIDDTEALQRAINTNKIVYINRNLIISDTIKLKSNSIIKGNGKSDISHAIKMANDGKFLFEFLTDEKDVAYDLTTGITFSDLKIEAKNFIRLNNRGYEFSKVGHIKGLKIDNCKITGKTKSNGKGGTSEIPSYEELSNEGIGIELTKVFDFSIRDSEIEKYGIAIDVLGTDIGLVDNCRLAYNDRHYHAQRTGTYGSQCKIKNCDLMWNNRYGGIYLNNTDFDTIEDNYFECYYDSGTFIVLKGGIGTTIFNNRFDDNKKPKIPMCLFEPTCQFTFKNNRFSRSETPSYIEILPTNIDLIFMHIFAFIENNSGIIIKKCPFVIEGSLDLSLFNVNNVNYVGGGLSNEYPFELINEEWVLRKTSDNCILRLKNNVKTDNLKLFIETSDTEGTFHVNLRKNAYNGTMIYSGQINKSTHLRTLSNMSDCDYLYVEFISNTVNLKSLKLFNIISE